MNWFRNISLLLLIATTSLSIVSFIALTSAISDPAIDNFDIYISSTLFQHKTAALTLLFSIITCLFSPVSLSLAALVLMLIFITRGEFFAAHLIVLSMTLGNLSFLSVKFFLHRLRPDLIPNQISGFSYPSGHATISALFFTFILGIFLKRIQSSLHRFTFTTLCLLAIILTGLSRIYLGNHWFTDVIGGYILGIAALFFAAVNNRIAMRVQRQECQVSGGESP